MKGKTGVLAFCTVALQLLHFYCSGQSSENKLNEAYRPQIHFSPKAHWINDPNGMVYYKGIYHLFFQYYPGGTKWGPMHWGHATSTDLLHWVRQSIALYPDSLGYIFSGSAVADENNTSGFGKNGKLPLVAIFTHHDPEKEKAQRTDVQTQSLAYSLDDGKTWIKYAGNPVLKNPGITDFRDPKVIWFEDGKKWIMTLATKDRITFYSSTNLKDWTKESEFGEAAGAHGGVWECPDLFTLEDNGRKVWVLIVNINPGGPNEGSGTQYFLGDFDGHKFTSPDTTTKWLDYGPDDYAGVTWNNTGDRKIFLGWMSNWMYANEVPSVSWRNAMTIPRELKLRNVNGELYVTSEPVSELSMIALKPIVVENITVEKPLDFSEKTGVVKLPCRLDLTIEKLKDFSIVLTNDQHEKTVIGYDRNKNHFFIDRTNSGKTDFMKVFAAIHSAPRLSDNTGTSISLIIDVSSVELFADDGLTVMTEIFFPTNPYNKILIESRDIEIDKLTYKSLQSIW